MDTGLIVSRYALALVRLVEETGGGDAVCAEATALGKAMKEVPGLAQALRGSSGLSAKEKISLAKTALGGSISPEMERFLGLLASKGRDEYLPLMLSSFIREYYRRKGIRVATLRTVSPPSEEMLAKIRALVKEKAGFDVIINVVTDPELIGGFVFDVDDYLVDSSVKRQLDTVRRQFIRKNRRIV